MRRSRDRRTHGSRTRARRTQTPHTGTLRTVARRGWVAVAMTYVVVAFVGSASFGWPAAVAADPPVPRVAQWHLDAVGAERARKASTGTGVTVAVIDSGVDATRPTLAGQLLPGAQFGQPTSPTGQKDTAPTKGHGTMVSGIIAGRGGPSYFDPIGVAPGAKILPIAVDESSSNIASAIQWATDRGAKVINLSLIGRGAAPPALDSAIQYAMSRDVVVIASAGNVDQTGPTVANPASIPGVLAVSGVDRNQGPWSNSARGPQVGISAPAVQIVGPVPTTAGPDGLAQGDGTSFAAPIVAGTAALIRAKYPKLDAPNVINRLLRSAIDRGAHGRDPIYGYGTLDAGRAVSLPIRLVSGNPLLAPAGGAAATPAPVEPSASAVPDDGAGTPSQLARPRQTSDEGGLSPAAIVVLAVVPVLFLVGIAVTVRDAVRRRRLASVPASSVSGSSVSGPSVSASSMSSPMASAGGGPPVGDGVPAGSAQQWPYDATGAGHASYWPSSTAPPATAPPVAVPPTAMPPVAPPPSAGWTGGGNPSAGWAADGQWWAGQPTTYPPGQDQWGQSSAHPSAWQQSAPGQQPPSQPPPSQTPSSQTPPGQFSSGPYSPGQVPPDQVPPGWPSPGQIPPER